MSTATSSKIVGLEEAAALQREGDPHLAPFEDDRRVLGERIGDALRLGGEQMLGIGMPRMPEQLLGDVVLLHLAALHHVDVVGELADDGQVVGDQDHRHAVALLQLLDQVEDLRLDGDVERGRRLVGDQHVGTVGERHGDHDALALAAGELVRILPQTRLRLGDLHFLEQLARALRRLGAAHPVVQMRGSR